MQTVWRVFHLFLLLALILVPVGCALRNPISPLTATVVRSGDLARDGNAAMEQGDWEEAERKLEEAVKLNRDEIETRLHYAEALWMRGKQSEALAILYDAAERSTKQMEKSQAAASAAAKLLELGKNDVAVSWADQCVRETPRDYRGWWLRAKALMRIGNEYEKAGRHATAQRCYWDACNDFYRALAFQPPERELLPELARLQMQMNEPEHALATWQHLLRLYPPGDEPAIAFCGKGDTLALMGRFDDAADCFVTASLREPDNLAICLRHVELELQAGRTEQAKQAFLQAERLAPHHPAVRQLAGNMNAGVR